jgi:ATP-dependent protease Clp ATPase subunit
LKNAAHELKTPVAKGVIVAHMVENEKQKGRLLTIFSSMTAIIEGIMTDTMYDLPELSGYEIIVNKECITEGAKPLKVKLSKTEGGKGKKAIA